MLVRVSKKAREFWITEFEHNGQIIRRVHNSKSEAEDEVSKNPEFEYLELIKVKEVKQL